MGQARDEEEEGTHCDQGNTIIIHSISTRQDRTRFDATQYWY